jgi:hypothetical protein
MPRKKLSSWPRGKWPRPPKEEYFKARLNFMDNGCILWTGGKNSDGYGVLRKQTVHRYAYELSCGQIPSDKEIDHLCNNRLCVNVLHMECVTHQENIARSWARGSNEFRRNRLADLHKSKTHCKNGHPYEGENLVIDKWNGARRCKICETAKFHRYQAKQRISKA